MYDLPDPSPFCNSRYQTSSGLIDLTSGRQLSFKNTKSPSSTENATNPRVARPVGDFGIKIGRPTMYVFATTQLGTDTFLLGYHWWSPTLSNTLENIGSVTSPRIAARFWLRVLIPPVG